MEIVRNSDISTLVNKLSIDSKRKLLANAKNRNMMSMLLGTEVNTEAYSFLVSKLEEDLGLCEEPEVARLW